VKGHSASPFSTQKTLFVMKIVKRIVLVLLACVVLFVGAAFAIPYFFKDEIMAKLKTAINQNLDAKVDFRDLNLSLFRNFPNLNLQLEGLTVDGVQQFEGIRLADVGELGMTLDLRSVWQGMDPIVVKGVQVADAKAHILVAKDGKANYLISKPSTDTSSTDFQLKLENYQISNSTFIYDDASLGVYAKAAGIEHEGSGDLTATVYDLDTETSIDSLTVSYGGLSYLKNANAKLDAIFNIDQANSKYTLKDNDLLVNALRLVLDGWVQLPNENDIAMDLAFKAPENNFRNLFSIIPGAYLQGYEKVKIDGSFALSGTVKGTYNGESGAYPAFNINLGVDNGRVKYPDLPLGISNIFAKGNINSPGSNFDQMVIDFSRFALKIGSNPIDARFVLKTPMSDPNLDAKVKGILNLKELSQAYPMEGMENLSGKISADIVAKARQSQIEKQQYEQVDMRGNARVEGMVYQSAGLPAVKIQDAQMSFSPQYVDITRFKGLLGKSDLEASGRVDNILAYFSPNKTMTGSLKARSHLFDANEWVSGASTEPSAAAVAGTSPATTEIFDRFDFQLDAQADRILYDKYELKNTIAQGQLSPNRLTLAQASTQIKDSDIAATGTVTNVFDYLFKGANLGGDVKINSNKLDLNQFMSDFAGTPADQPQGTASTQEYGVILVPDNINMHLTANVGDLTYTNMNIKALKGDLVLADKAVELRDVQGNTLGGTVGFAGLYDTKDPKNPLYNVKLDLAKMDFQQSFKTFNTFQLLAPVGNFISGVFNTSLVLQGNLKDNMMPDLSTVDAKGFLETVNGLVKGFAPLEKVGEALNISELKKDLIINSKNWLEIRQGGVDIKPHDLNIKDIQMTIAGRHTIKQEINYSIKTRLPRKYLDQNVAGKALSAGWRQIQSQASKAGVQLADVEFVNVLVNLTGSIKDPKVQFQLLGADGKTMITDAAKDALNKELDEQKQKLEAEKQKLEAEAKKKLEEATAKAKDKAGKVADSLRVATEKELAKKKAELEQKAKETIQKEVGGKLSDTLSTKAKEQVGKVLDKTKAKDEVDKVKKEMEKFNPFKKKPAPAKDSTGTGGN
jgi:hypothetical protein